MAHDRPDPIDDDADSGGDLSRIYAQTPRTEPPKALDDFILGAARSEVQPAQAAAVADTRGGPRMPRAPWAMAALVVLAAMLYQVVPERKLPASAPIVVSMADRAPQELSELQGAPKPAPDLRAGEAWSGMGAVVPGADARQKADDAEAKQQVEHFEQEADTLAAPAPIVIARSQMPATPAEPEPRLARSSQKMESRAAPAAVAVREPDPDAQPTFSATPEKQIAAESLESAKAATSPVVSAAALVRRAPGRMSRETRLSAAAPRKDAPAAVAELADSSVTAGARADLSARDNTVGEAVTAQVLIFAGAVDSGILSEQAGAYDGLGVQLARQLAEQAGYRVEFRALPLNQAVEQTRSGAADAVIGVAASIAAGDSLQSCGEAFTPDGLVFAFSTRRALGGLCEPFDAELARMRRSGELAALQRRYGVR